MNKKTVYVGMSGGVDSSVAAALLKEQGLNVVGVFMKNWHATDKKFAGVCPWEQDLRDARTVAAQLDIPLKVWNFEKQYHDRVVTYFFNEYKAGRTPNPDVMCNSQIKFNEFYKKAIAEGADFIATGHYARVEKNKTGEYELLAGTDKNKDQSYFLWDIDRKVLPRVLMPIGAYTKPQIRELAKKYNLATAQKKDSQGICFIGPINVREYLKTQLQVKKGDVVTVSGEKIGEHEGVWFYTEGQRKGTGSTGGGVPYYVVEKDAKNNKLIVAPRASRRLFAKGLVANKINWLIKNPAPLFPSPKIKVRIRYRHPAVPAIIENKDGDIVVKFSQAQRAVTPGQSVVIYYGDQLLGGGVIETALV